MSAPADRLRIGDAERAAAADRLARHFSHGRLDQAELDDRLDRVMHARTAGDLTEMFTDLPADEPATAGAVAGQLHGAAARRRNPGRPRRRRGLAVVLAVLIIAGMSLTLRAAMQSPWPAGGLRSVVIFAVIGLIAVLWLRRGRAGDRG